MISRIWHGYATPYKADTYEKLLRTEIFAAIAGRQIPGFREIQLFRRSAGDEVEFITASRTWRSWTKCSKYSRAMSSQ